MHPSTAALIARAQAMPMTHTVVTRFADGTERRFDVRSAAAGENYATGERRKIGKDLMNRLTGATSRAVSVEVVTL